MESPTGPQAQTHHEEFEVPRGAKGGRRRRNSGHDADLELIKTSANSTLLVVSFRRYVRFVVIVFAAQEHTNTHKMKIAVSFTVLLFGICLASAFPQKDGAIFSNEAIRQAQNTFLIPKDAQIQKVQEGIEVAAYENIKGDESINLFQILGDQVPPEVVSNLQAQVEQIGKH